MICLQADCRMKYKCTCCYATDTELLAHSIVWFNRGIFKINQIKSIAASCRKGKKKERKFKIIY